MKIPHRELKRSSQTRFMMITARMIKTDESWLIMNDNLPQSIPVILFCVQMGALKNGNQEDWSSVRPQILAMPLHFCAFWQVFAWTLNCVYILIYI
jgi:hypothetical protein